MQPSVFDSMVEYPTIQLGNGGSIPTKTHYKVGKCEFEDIRHIFEQFHYKGGHMGGGISFCLALYDDLNGKIVGLHFSSANASDREMLKVMNKDLRGIFVADAGYVSAQLEKEFFIEHQRMLLTCSRTNMKKVATFTDIELLKTIIKLLG